MPSYRVAFVNPYVTAAEVQAFESLREAADAMGIVLEHREPKDMTEDDRYDFLIPVAFTPKTTSHPSFLSAHSPRTVYVDSEEMFGAVCSHDGYLTISKNLKTFFGHVSSSYGKVLTEVGDYYNCPQTTGVTTDLRALNATEGVGLCYFGINWDMRAEPLFRLLSQQPYMRIYGPSDSWRTVRPEAYKGQLPFNGAAVQREYARFGVGLVCLGYEHLMDDIISNRVFEISSVGAVAISPDTPWMRENFGGSVYYYDPFASVEAIVAQIDAAFQAIRADPIEAQRRADDARAIFERRFHAGAMLQGAVAYFEQWKAAAVVPTDIRESEIDIVVLGSDPVGIEVMLGSLKRQRAGRFNVIHAGERLFEPEGAILRVKRVQGGETTADALSAALAETSAPRVVVVAAGDRFLSHHFERLLVQLSASRGATLAYSDALGANPADDSELTIVRQGAAGGDLAAILERLPTPCVLADRELCQGLDPRRWGLGDTDTLRVLVAQLLARSRPVHAPGPTCILAPGGSSPSTALEERLAVTVELAPVRASVEALFAGRQSGGLAPIAAAVTDLIEAKLDAIAPERVFEGGMIGRDVAERADLIHVVVPLAAHRLAAITPWTKQADGTIRFRPAAAFDIALRVDIGDYVMPGCRPSIIFGLESAEDILFLGLVDAAGEIVARTITPKSRKPVKVWVNSQFGEPPVEAIIQAWKRAPSSSVGLTELTLAYRVEELAAAASRPDLTHAEALAMLIERAETEVVGLPIQFTSIEPVDLHHPRSAFRHFVREEAGEETSGRVFRTGDVGWDYFGQIFVPAVEGAVALKLDLHHVSESCSVFLTNTGFDRVVSPIIRLRAGKTATTVWLPMPEEAKDLYLVLQANEQPDDSEMVLRRLSMAAGSD